MTIDEDPLLIAVKQFSEDQVSAADSIADIATKVFLSAALPFGVGSCITGTMTELGQLRWKRRVHALLVDFAEKFKWIETQIPDKGYYSSEEFQALIFEAIDQQRTNLHEWKRKMLASGLANSGTGQFIGWTEKEQFVRLLRELTAEDVKALRSMWPFQNPNLAFAQLGHRSFTLDQGKDNSTFNRLQGLGLARSMFQIKPRNIAKVSNIRTQEDVNRAVENILNGTPTSIFSISELGTRFLLFLNDPGVIDGDPTVTGFAEGD